MIKKDIKSSDNVLIISDIHLGDGTGSDDFQYSSFRKLKDAQKNLIAWITKIDPTVLILNGDIKELWQHNLNTVDHIYKDLLEFFVTRQTIILEGNHDFLSKNDTQCVLTLSNNKTVYIAHGHQDSPLMANPFLKFITWVTGMIEKVFPSIDNVLSLIQRFSKKDITKATVYAIKMLEKYDYVILGHTHVLGEVIPNYFNSGTCQWGMLEGVMITKNALSCIKG